MTEAAKETTERISSLLNFAGRRVSKIGTAVFTLAGCVAFADAAIAVGLTSAMLQFASGLFGNLLSGRFLDILDKGTNISPEEEEELLEILKEIEAQLADDADLRAKIYELLNALHVSQLALEIAIEEGKKEIILEIWGATSITSQHTRDAILARLDAQDEFIKKLVENRYASDDTYQTEQLIEAAADDEVLIVLGKFIGSKREAVIPLLLDAIKDNIARSRLVFRVEQLKEEIADDGQALAVLKQYRASIVIWGIATEFGLRLKQQAPIRVNVGELIATETRLHNPQSPEFFMEINEYLPNYISAYTLMVAGGIFLQNENLKGARRAFDTVIQKYYQHTNIKTHCLFERGYLHWLQNKNYDAIDDFTRVIKSDPQHSIAYVNRGINYLATQQYTLAQKDYEDAETAATAKNDLEALVHIYYSMANLASSKKDYRSAYNLHQKSLEIGLFVSSAQLNNLGFVCLEMKQYEEAIKYFTQAIDLNWQWSDFGLAKCYVNRGATYYKLEDYHLAIADFSATIDLRDDIAEAYFDRAQSYKNLWLQDNPQAFYPDGSDIPDYLQRCLSDFERAYQLAPTDPEKLLMLGMTQLSLQTERDAGLENLRVFVRQYPTHTSAPKIQQRINAMRS